jgi:outer membrane protein assembly factor BamB
VTGAAVIFGSGDGRVYAVDSHGRQEWAVDVGAPAYGGPLVVGQTAYIGDNSGRVHAIDLTRGEVQWRFERAAFAIESPPAAWGELIVFGAWDGQVYAVGAADGKLRWKSPGPKASDGKAIRYFSPADCAPLALGDRLYVCDRGYVLGRYTRDGRLEQTWPAQSAALARAADLPPAATAPIATAPAPRETFLVRTTDDKLRKLDADGGAIWEASVPTGRFPAPPTVAAGRVYVCSNRGRLSVLDESTGELLWNYQSTAGFYVMAPVAVAADSARRERPVAIVAGMDGTLAAVRGQ